MPRFFTLIFSFLLSGNVAFATIDIFLANSSPQTLTVSYLANSNYASAPFNVWNSQVFTMRWNTALGANLITGITNLSAFTFALDGAPVNGNDGFFYQKFTAAATNVSQSIVNGGTLDVLNISIFNASECAGDFELITGTPFVNSIFGTASANNVLGEQFNDFNPALVENVLLNPTASIETWFEDADGDGKGNPNVSIDDCEQPQGFVLDDTDCDDTNQNLPTTPGSTCDDGDPQTIDDVILADGCDCEGTFVDCPALEANIGDPCDDGDPCTDGDEVQPDCTCAGIFTDDDNDGVCNNDDLCPGGPEPGSPCTDNDPTTTNDLINANCLCVGTPTNCTGIGDADGDGVCANVDCNDNDPQATGNIGAPCNDNNTCTVNDVVVAGCGCAGTFEDSDNDGICDANDVCPNGPNPGSPCDDGNPNTTGTTIQNNCTCGGGTPVFDCPTLSLNFGDPCDDGNPNTTGTTVQNNCTCGGGTPVFDCPTLSLNFGDPCDDGNPNTTGTTVQNNCLCGGGTSVFDCPTLSLNFGDPCDDGNPNTTGTTVQNNCTCDGEIPVFDCPTLSLNFGDPCDDSNPNTTGTTVQNNCTCDGGIPVFDCPTLSLNFGDPCDDGDVCTENDEVQPNCTCAGVAQDSDNDGTCDANDICPGPEPGSSCNDGNPNTVNDMINSNCQCAGVPPGNGITLSCPPDIEIVVPMGSAGTNLTFPAPLASSACNGGAGCNPIAIPGFSLMGEFGGSLFYLSTISKTWEDARLDCVAKGGQLAVITSASENQFVANHLGYGNAAFIGLTDKANEGTFTWANGAAVSYTNWEPGEPNNGSGFPENYVVMHGWTLGKWADYNVWVAKPYILEITCNPSGGSGSGLNGAQSAGPASGSFFAIGQQTISYLFTDNCGNQATCSFNVNVVEEAQSGDCSQLLNLALNGQATQSSNRFNALAQRAVDGNTSGNFWGDFSVSHTEWEDNAWWQIDLGKKYDLKYVNIWNRTDCCQQFLSNFHVLVSDEPFMSNNLAATLAQVGVTAYYQGGQVGLPTTITTERSGRYVRIQLAGQAFLAMSEVEIFGCPANNFSSGNPSNLISFNASLNNALQTDLLWVARSSQVAISQTIEKSADGAQYFTLMELPVMGELEGRHVFHEIDRNPFEGDNFYRVKITFADGGWAYSDVKRVAFTPASDFDLLPNPASDHINIYMKRFQGKEVTLLFTNTLGQVVHRLETGQVTDAIYPVELPGEQFKDGVYFVSVVHKGRALTRRLVITRY